nr:MAG TPA: hypothetical protein [Caudoviricetes sp.]
MDYGGQRKIRQEGGLIYKVIMSNSLDTEGELYT